MLYQIFNSSPAHFWVTCGILVSIRQLLKLTASACIKILTQMCLKEEVVRHVHYAIYLLWGRIFSQAGNELGARSFLARNELSMVFPYTSFPAGNELVLKLTKNTASALWTIWFVKLTSAMTKRHGKGGGTFCAKHLIDCARYGLWWTFAISKDKKAATAAALFQI
jgi:hypothetical protein